MCIGYFSSYVIKYYKIDLISNTEENKSNNDEEEKKLAAYNACLSKEYDDSELSDELTDKINEIDVYIKTNYYASVVYEDVNTGFSYKYNEDDVYYGASLIKIVEAEYLFDKAAAGEIDINDTIKYTSKYVADYSDGMSKRTIGEDVTIKDLISYAIMYSDNSAHFMLSDYIGVSNLRSYGQALGAKNILTGGDTFGNQSASDTNIYLHHAYEIINSGSEYGKLLKEYMTNTYYNSLYLTDEEDNNVAHKYGWYSNYYHDIGIVYEDYPYYVSILTNHGKGDYKTVVNNIHKKINELHHLFYEQREQSCHLEVYGS
jgi:beta-lactamase class A